MTGGLGAVWRWYRGGTEVCVEVDMEMVYIYGGVFGNAGATGLILCINIHEI